MRYLRMAWYSVAVCILWAFGKREPQRWLNAALTGDPNIEKDPNDF